MKTPQWLQSWRIRRKVGQFKKGGSMPWTRGYEEFKAREICRILSAGNFDPNQLPIGYGFRLDERIIELPWLFSRLRKGRGRLLDAGSSLNFEEYLTHPALDQKKIHICTLAPETNCFWNRGVSYLFGDLRDLPYRDAWFDEIACISTLEHVGMDNTRLYTKNPTYRENAPGEAAQALFELFRVLRSGGRLYLTIPTGKSANLGWLQIFDARSLEDLISRLSPQSVQSWIYQYHFKGWQRASASEVAEAMYYDWNQTKVYDQDFTAAAKAVCCMELIKK